MREVVGHHAVTRAPVETQGFTKSWLALSAHEAGAGCLVGENIWAELLGVELGEIACVLDGLSAVSEKGNVGKAYRSTFNRSLRDERQLLGNVRIDR